ncbi:cell division protein FtsK [Mycobacteroides sp. PCS013]|uniref:cell division protein FtsK n=1 Tax=Mycobacteroides sp. PCS013 TaxID=3074106 RepID=UPI003C2C9117
MTKMPVKAIVLSLFAFLVVGAVLPTDLRLGLLLIAALAAIVWALIHWQRSAEVRSSFDPPLSTAIELLQSPKKFQNLCRSVGLTHTSKARSGWSTAIEPVEHLPTVVGSALPTPYGASLAVLPALGHSVETWQSAAPRLQAALSVPSIVVIDRSDHLEVQLRVKDPLSTDIVADHVIPASDLSLGLGFDEDGNWLSLPVANTGGLVVGGLPGSGKTAWLTGVFAALASSPLCQWVLVDAKHGHDLAALAPRSYRYLAAEADLLDVRDGLREVQLLMNHRRKNMIELIGTPNFWSAPISPSNPVVFVVVDEVQQLQPTAFVTKEDKALATEIDLLIRDLVRLGRSAGIVVVLSTQRPTADAISTPIRDNAELRVCFNVRSRESAVAVLGEWSTDDLVSPLGLPTGVGVAYVNSELCKFRAPFTPEPVLVESVLQHQQLTADPLDLLSQALFNAPD